MVMVMVTTILCYILHEEKVQFCIIGTFQMSTMNVLELVLDYAKGPGLVHSPAKAIKRCSSTRGWAAPEFESVFDMVFMTF